LRTVVRGVPRRGWQRRSTLGCSDSTRDGGGRTLTELVPTFSALSWHPPCSDWGVSRMAPLPVAIVMSSFEPGGTERQMIELVRRLDRSKWRVEVACLRAGGAWADRIKSVAPVTPFPAPSFRRPSVVHHLSAFVRWCRDRRIAVVHTTDMPSNIFALPAAALAGVPVRIANRREIDPGRSAGAIGMQRAVYGC